MPQLLLGALTFKLLEFACRFGDQVRVIGNTGSNSTREAVHATSQGFAVGMHAALQINPYYGKTSATGMRTHFEARRREVSRLLEHTCSSRSHASGGSGCAVLCCASTPR